MDYAKVTINVPQDMVSYIKVKNESDELERNALLLYPYIKNFIISHGRAAEILGVNRLDLIELYSSLGIPYLDMDISEVEDDIKCFKMK